MVTSKEHIIKFKERVEANILQYYIIYDAK